MSKNGTQHPGQPGKNGQHANGNGNGNGNGKGSVRQATARTLGPISDLERHLPVDWWRNLFNAVYLKTDGDVVENNTNTEADIDLLIRTAGLDANDRVLDLCCGQGRHALALARRGFRSITGIDRSRYLIRLARRRARDAGLTVDFKEGDARRFRASDASFHCVAILGNSFGYFDQEEDDLAVLGQVRRVLKPGGTLAMDITDGEWMRQHFERRSWEWIDENHFVCRERTLGASGERLVTREVVVHAEKGVIADQFYAERLYSRARIEEMLARTGFTNVRVHGSVASASDRGQDLGMMANRIFITAASPRAVMPVVGKRMPFPSITVVMGDPKLPDQVKFGGHFNAEDLETIQRTKTALAELTEYKFSYVDNHAAFLTQMRSSPPEFVLNLCDEGFNNDAQMELHIPAYLEMLGIPYTGSGPATLALCYNKSQVRAVATALDISVPLETYCDPTDQGATIPAVFPALLKPAWGDSSVGITQKAVVTTADQAIEYLAYLRELLPGRPVLIQEFLTGPEYSVSIIGNPGLGLTALPVLEVDYRRLPDDLPPILAYESKWDPKSPYWSDIRYHEARIEEDTRRQLIDMSMLLFERLGCRDYARFDFRADAHGQVKLLEANPNPGWCWDGKLNIMAGFAGIRYAELLRQIIDAAQARIAEKRVTASPNQLPVVVPMTATGARLASA
ncbi:MAG: methyltransferase domain-containing protein [Alphaproteobacteria bacterium]|nr:methyltransferase domain-containing protein [Alphaproteobacteria bacterium]